MGQSSDPEILPTRDTLRIRNDRAHRVNLTMGTYRDTAMGHD